MVTARPTTDGIAGQPSSVSGETLRFSFAFNGGTFGFGFAADGTKPASWRDARSAVWSAASARGAARSRGPHRRSVAGDGRPLPA